MNADNLNDMTIDDIYELINWEIVSKDLYIRFVEGNYESEDKEKLIQILLDQQQSYLGSLGTLPRDFLFLEPY